MPRPGERVTSIEFRGAVVVEIGDFGAYHLTAEGLNDDCIVDLQLLGSDVQSGFAIDLPSGQTRAMPCNSSV